MQATKSRMIAFLKEKLSVDREWMDRVLLRLYSLQTDVEKDTSGEYSDARNGVGFTSFDRQILTSFAEQRRRGRCLSWRQWEILGRRLPKYARQIVAITPRDELLGVMRVAGWLDAGEVRQ